MKMNKLVVLAAVAAMSLAGIASSLGVGAVSVGKPAPVFTTVDATGKALDLSSYKGKFVVLEWSNFGCPFVKKHYDSGNMQKLQKEYTAKGVVWMTVFSSAEGKQGYYEPAELTKLAAEKKMASTKLIPDPQGTLGHLYGATNTPSLFVINPKGEVIYMGAIDDTPTPDAADIAHSKNYVAEALDAALAGKPVPTTVTKPYGCSVKYKG